MGYHSRLLSSYLKSTYILCISRYVILDMIPQKKVTPAKSNMVWMKTENVLPSTISFKRENWKWQTAFNRVVMANILSYMAIKEQRRNIFKFNAYSLRRHVDPINECRCDFGTKLAMSLFHVHWNRHWIIIKFNTI